MAYSPAFTITPALLHTVEQIAALRERILSATVTLPWIPALQKDSRSRNVHASTAIEGNPLTLREVVALEEGRSNLNQSAKAGREVLNYFAGLRYVEKRSRATRRKITHDDILRLHHLLAEEVMDQGQAGRYRTISVRVGRHVPPPPDKVSGYMFELLEWWNNDAPKLSPVLSSAILHYRFEAIHPFADGNGRTGRALALWELYRRGFDTHHIFAVDEHYWEDRPLYYASLDAVRKSGEDLTAWLEYCASGLAKTLERAWLRVQALQAPSKSKLVLSPTQERLLHLLRDSQGIPPAEIWEALDMTRQGAMGLIRPLMQAGLIERVGGKKTGRYILKKR